MGEPGEERGGHFGIETMLCATSASVGSPRSRAGMTSRRSVRSAPTFTISPQPQGQKMLSSSRTCPIRWMRTITASQPRGWRLRALPDHFGS